jgi:hypothetical protein
MNQIERLNSLRKNLLKGLLWASGIWLGILSIWIAIIFNRIVSLPPTLGKIIIPSLQGVVYVSALIVLFYALKYWIYKSRLKQDPSLRAALNDERISLGWLKAYRFAFFTLVVFHVLLLSNQAIGNVLLRSRAILLPQFAEIPFVLLLAVLSCVGSFLHYIRED